VAAIGGARGSLQFWGAPSQFLGDPRAELTDAQRAKAPAKRAELMDGVGPPEATILTHPWLASTFCPIQ